MYGTRVNNKGKTEKNKKVKEGSCIFPFKYKFKEHNECIDSPTGKKCATSVNENNTLVTYGYCVPFKKETPKNKTMKKAKTSHKKSQKKKKKVKLVVVEKERLSSLKQKTPPKSKKKKKKIKLVVVEKEKSPERAITLKKGRRKVKKLKKKLVIKNNETNMPITKQSLRSASKSPMMETSKPTRHNEEFIGILAELENYMSKKGEFMRSRAYQKAQEAIMTYPENITDVDQISGLRGIGKTITSKLNEYLKTGKVEALEKEKRNPIHVFTSIYGVGPKKAQQLIKDGIDSIAELRKRQDSVLTETQRMGLKYYEDINKRIPRSEVEDYEKEFAKIFDKIKDPDANFQIVGSYRRGNANSGDIDIIITDKQNNPSILKKFVEELVKAKIIIYKLTDGKSKILVIAQLPGKPARRVDFLFSPPKEFAFAILYFTGSKIFNTMMRQRALDLGYSLNEHGFYKMVNGKKGAKIDMTFNTEKDIFDFLNMEFKEPTQRKDGRAVVIKKDSPVEDVEPEPEITIKPKKTSRNKTLKKAKAESPSQNIKTYKREGTKYLKKLTEKQIGDMIRYANDMYYNDPDAVLMTDTQFDIIKEFLYRKYPKSVMLKEVGAPISTANKNKVVLPYNMPSMDKIKPSTDALKKWLAKKDNSNPKEYVFSAKLDGVSGMFVSKDGEKNLYTRGNGKVGQDISHLIPYLKLPDDSNIVIRGEFLISKENFTKHFSDKKNARNTIAGIINKLKISPKELKNIDFVAYETIVPTMKPSAQLEFLEDKNVDVVRFQKAKNVDNEELSELLIEWRENYKYEIDGIIVTHDRMRAFRADGNPAHAFAFKMILSDQMVEANVVDVIWSPSKYGYLKPKIEIDPVEIGGATITYATAFNAEFVEKHKLGVGAVVLLQRSGDVIPHILKVLQPAHEAKMPDLPYVWNKTHVDILLADTKSNKIVQGKIITNFFKNLEVDGLGGGNVKRMTAAGYDTIPKILAMTKSDFLKVDGFKEKLATKIYEGIQAKIKSTDLITLMKASNIFGKGLGERKIKPILEKYPDILESKEKSEAKIDKVSSVPGIGQVLAEKFVDSIPEFLEFMKEAKLTSKLKTEIKKQEFDTSDPLFEKKIVMTGFRDKQLIEDIKSRGGVMGSSVSKKTFAVLVMDKDESTGKADQARALGVPLMTPDEFKSKYIN